MFDPSSTRQLTRLTTAITDSLKQMRVFTTKRREAYEQYVGSHYSDQGSKEPVPLNFIAMAANVFLQSLVSSDPQCRVEVSREQLIPGAASFELAMNRVFAEMDLGRALRTWSFEAMMCPFGILKVCLDASECQEVEGMQTWSGMPMIEPVLFEDWVHDMSAKRLDRAGFYGNRYQIDKDYALSSNLYDPEIVAKLEPLLRAQDWEREANLSRHKDMQRQDYRDMLELWDIWLPDEGLLVTISRQHEDLGPLRVVEWTGPKKGPYHFLWFNGVPGQTLPLPPVALWRDIHDLANLLFNKLGKQAMRQKTLTGVGVNAKEDGQRIKSAGDGDMIPLDHPDSVKEVRHGGIDNANFGFVMGLKQLHNWAAGNPDTISGSAPMTSTVGQEQLLNQAATQRVQEMRREVYSGVEVVMHDAGWYLFTNPIANVPITKTVPGTSVEIRSQWNQDVMQGGDWYDFAVRLIPQSLQMRSPEQELQILDQTMMQILMPLSQTMAQAGQMVNIEEYLEHRAKLLQMPILRRLVNYTQGRTTEGAAQDAPQVPPTQRPPPSGNNSVKTQQGQETSMIQALMSGRDQGGAMAGAM
jgi:hypothetical protein